MASLQLTGTIRDFQDSHPDFEYLRGIDLGIVKTILGSNKKPVYAGQQGNPTTNGQTSFDQWYQDAPSVNQSKQYSITLEDPDEDGIFTYTNSSFFPIDNQLFGNQGRSHNYHFTYELHSQFTYQGGETFNFFGDDDLFVFIDDELVIDLGGVHEAARASVNLDDLGLMIGEAYDFDLFFAERHTIQSAFQIETSIKLEQPESGDSLVSLQNGDLGVVDIETGALDVVATGVSLTDIALTADGTLFGSTFGQLYEIDLESNSFLEIGAFGANINALGATPEGNLYGAGESGDFYSIDSTTGKASLIANLGSNFISSGDIVFDKTTDRFWATSRRPGADSLVSIALTGEATVVGSIGFDEVWGLSLDTQGNLLGYTAAGEQIAIDSTTGQGRLINQVTPLPAAIGGATEFGQTEPQSLVITGTNSRDTLMGGSGNDLIIGLRDHDELIGNGGDDRLIGGYGNDTLEGGTGKDSFVFDTGRSFRAREIGIDTIIDFESADQIVLDKNTFTQLANGTGQFSSVSSLDSTQISAAVITYDRSTGALYYNENGEAAGFGKGGQFAILTNKFQLAASNFVAQA